MFKMIRYFFLFPASSILAHNYPYSCQGSKISTFTKIAIPKSTLAFLGIITNVVLKKYLELTSEVLRRQLWLLFNDRTNKTENVRWLDTREHNADTSTVNICQCNNCISFVVIYTCLDFTVMKDLCKAILH
jgi:hypothetical protein